MYLYAIKSALTGWIKFGYSRMPASRLRSLKAGGTELGLDMGLTLIGEVPLLNVALERAIHKALAHARVRGEWFFGYDGSVISLVEEVFVGKRTELHVWLGLRQIRQARASGIRPDAQIHSDVSLRAFARQIGVSETAVRKAIASGRLTRSLGTSANGRPFIADVALARAVWNNSARTMKPLARE